jgi:hypothetical protein
MNRLVVKDGVHYLGQLDGTAEVDTEKEVVASLVLRDRVETAFERDIAFLLIISADGPKKSKQNLGISVT